jgi:aryl-alcohol dehydrogenase-like predicted oxidoreductase
MVAGHATTEGTAGYFNSRNELGGWLEAGLHCSNLGFGGYRVDDETPLFEEAVKTALLSGCNLIDTSTNYADGRSERMIGGALAELIKVGVLDRDQVIVVSKVGYVQGQALELAQQRETAGDPFPEMVKYQDGCWHCIHPDFLKIQIEKSRERLGLECIDFYLLHNPEYFLMDAAKRGSTVMLSKLRDQFYERVQRAFAFLEGEVAKGTIRGYGVSSNSFGAKHTRADATSVSRMWEAAEAVAPKHHFKVIQLPLNLFESGPYMEKNTGPDNSQTALECASKHHLGVLVNRPLNAFTKDSLVRLADFAVKKAVEPLDSLLPELAELEEEFNKSIMPLLKGATGGAVTGDLFNWSSDLGQVRGVPLGADRWTQVEDQVRGHVSQVVEQISSQLKTGPWIDWKDRYLPQLDETLETFRNDAHQRSQKVSEKVAAKLNPLLPDAWKDLPLSRKALGVLIHTPGVSCVLNGMRRPDYVHDSMEATKPKAIEEEVVKKVFETFASP